MGLVALPLAMAFGIASGVTPQAGIYTAVIAGFLISALGGSRLQIGGPTGAFVVIVAGIIAKFGFSGLLIVTLMAGVILVIMGATGLGAAVKFIPRPVTVGFTNGIAVLIASTQIKDFLGLKTGPVPSEFLGRMEVLMAHLSTIHWPTLPSLPFRSRPFFCGRELPGVFRAPSWLCLRELWAWSYSRFRSKPSAASSAEFLPGFQPSRFPPSAPN